MLLSLAERIQVWGSHLCEYLSVGDFRNLRKSKPVRMAEYHEDAFVNSRKQKIFSACWLPVNDPTAILLFHHGLGEYTLRYKDKGEACLDL